jgi:phage terminase small subunit
MSSRKPPPPKHLRLSTASWWRDVQKSYDLEPHHCRLLQLAGEAWDRAEQAREAIAECGLTFTDRFGRPVARPEVAIERDSRLAFARLVRELDLDAEPTPAPSRPMSIRSNRRY